MTPPIPDIAIPAELLPADGRFGSGPSKVRHEAVEALAATGTTYLGTSHRQATARFTVAALRNGIAELLSLPDGYEVALGNGGTTAFWDAATFGLIDQRSQHLTFGEFSSKFAACAQAAPHLDDPWCPAFLDLGIALDNSRKDQTYNTPALATVFLAVQQIEWILHNGGLPFATGRCDPSAEILYGWAEARDYATPFVTDPAIRSHVVATIDLDDAVPATTVSAVLRQNLVIDTESYRKLGRNQLRIAMYPAIDPDDIEALTHCIDYVVERVA